jgi:hypothetical protein
MDVKYVMTVLCTQPPATKVLTEHSSVILFQTLLTGEWGHSVPWAVKH